MSADQPRVDKETVEKIARLARIHVAGERQDDLSGELDKILSWVAQLSEVDTGGVEPLTSVVARVQPQRMDLVDDGGDSGRVTANAPAATHDFYSVPKVVE